MADAGSMLVLQGVGHGFGGFTVLAALALLGSLCFVFATPPKV